MVRLSGIQNIQPVFNTKSQFTNPVKSQAFRQDSFIKNVSFQGLSEKSDKSTKKSLNNQIQDAFYYNKEDKFLKLMSKKGFDPNYKLLYRQEPNDTSEPKVIGPMLVECLNRGWFESAVRLINHPYIDINEGNRVKNPLTSVIGINSKGLVDLIMANPNIDVNYNKFISKDTPLINSLFLNDMHAFNKLMEHEELDVNCQNSLKDCPLSIAMGHKDNYAFDKLMAHPKIDLTLKVYNGNNLLMEAIDSENIHAARALLLKGKFDLGAVNEKGQTIYDIAKSKDMDLGEIIYLSIHPDEPVIEKVKPEDLPENIAKMPTNDQVLYAFYHDSQDKLIDLMSRPDFDPNLGYHDKLKPGEIDDPRYHTPILVMCLEKYWFKSASMLLNHPNIDINAGNIINNPLSLAISYKFVPALFDRVMENPKINVNNVDPATKTPPLIRALRYENFYAFDKLMEHKGIDVNLKDCLDDNALAMAIRMRSRRVFDKLMSHPDIDVTARTGHNDNTLLMTALESENIYAARKLLATGKIDLNAVNKKGQTAHSLAKDYNIDLDKLIEKTKSNS